MTASEGSGSARPPLERLTAAIHESGLVRAGHTGVALVSGGPDSACLLAGLVEVLGAGQVTALHVNYGLRAESDADEAVAAGLCDRIGVELVVERPGPPEGNVQAWAREVRYTAADRLMRSKGAAWVAAGHTRSDRAETVIYRLASSPGTRSLLGMGARRGNLIRPLMSLGRAELRQIALEAGLSFTDDRSNEDPAFARARIRSEVIPVLKSINPAAERNIELTREELAEDEELLADLTADALSGNAKSKWGGAEGIAADTLRNMHPALRRRALRALAEDALGHPVPVPIALAAEILRLVLEPEGGQVDAGGGAFFRIEGGRVTVSPAVAVPSCPAPGAVDPAVRALLPLPGAVRSGEWRLQASHLSAPFVPRGPEVATLDLDALRRVCDGGLEVRRWQAGDRMRPLGMTGHRSLQDIFTDTGVPRSRRRSIPVLAAGTEIAWVPGVVVSESFRLGPASTAAVLLTAEVDPLPSDPSRPGSA
ncbi:MAG: tRNA lysidine(34) synthetase TilS [Actinomycetota bacterium]|nr:tRNA lysidine(34) synthetase TilS [Actinomycetota bacterium]